MSEREMRFGFGTLFKVLGEDGRIEVVTSLNKNGQFESATINETDEGKRWFFIGGSGDIDDIEEIVGQMNIEEVIKAAEEGVKQLGYGKLSEKMIAILRINGQEKPILLE